MVFTWQSVNFAKCNTENKQKINFLPDEIITAHSATNLTLRMTMTELSSLNIFINFFFFFLSLYQNYSIFISKIFFFIFISFVGSVVEWLTHRTDDQHGLGSKPTCAILLCSWERHFTALSPAWWS